MMDGATVRPAADWDEVERGAVVAGRAFGDEPGRSFFLARTGSAPALPLENTLLVLVDRKIVGQLQVYDRRVVVDGRVVRIGAIGNVAVLPEYRGRGVGSALLDHTAATLAERGYPFSILRTGPELTEFYGAGGWAEVPSSRHRVTDPTPIVGTPLPYETVRPEPDLAALRRLYDRTQLDRTGAVVRADPYWTDWLFDRAKRVVDPDRILCFRPEGEATGYLIWDRDGGTVECVEYGYTGDDRAGFLEACWSRLAERGPEMLWHPPFPSALAEAVDATVETEPVRGIMVQRHDGTALDRATGASLSSTATLVDTLTETGFHWSPADLF